MSKELCIYFPKDRSLIHLLFKASAQTLLSWFASQNKKEHFIPGFVSTLHTFGRDLKWNPHIHILLTEGASSDSIVWQPFKHISYPMLRKRFQATLMHLLRQKLDKDSFYPLECHLFKTYKQGFYVYAKPNSSNDPKKIVDYVVRYAGRPAMAGSPITHYDRQQVTFWYQRHEDNQKVTKTISAIDFIKRLIIHIPDEQSKTVRYYGLYAKKYRHHSKLFKMFSHSILKAKLMFENWCHRLLLSFGHDPLKCSCGYTFEFVDFFYPKKKGFDKKAHPRFNSS